MPETYQLDVPVNLIRLAVGLEYVGDLIADLDQALRAVIQKFFWSSCFWLGLIRLILINDIIRLYRSVRLNFDRWIRDQILSSWLHKAKLMLLLSRQLILGGDYAAYGQKCLLSESFELGCSCNNSCLLLFYCWQKAILFGLGEF